MTANVKQEEISNWREIKQINKSKSDTLVINITNREDGQFSERLAKQNSTFLKRNKTAYWHAGVNNNYDYVVLVLWRSRNGTGGKDVYIGETKKSNGQPKLIPENGKFIIPVKEWEYIGKTTSSINKFCAPNSISSGSATHFLKWQHGAALTEDVPEGYKVLMEPEANFKIIDPGEKEAVRKYRLNQNALRKLTLELFEGKCCLSRTKVKEILVCSHIKPWVVSERHEKCDPENTLMLAATWDRLFDRGLISFSNSGKIMVSKKLNKDDWQSIGIQREAALDEKFLTSGRKDYLKYHRENIFKNP